jgi:hypothetical protein
MTASYRDRELIAGVRRPRCQRRQESSRGPRLSEDADEDFDKMLAEATASNGCEDFGRISSSSSSSSSSSGSGSGSAGRASENGGV